MDQPDAKSTFEKYFTPVTVPIMVALIGTIGTFYKVETQKADELKFKKSDSQLKLVQEVFKSKNLDKAKSTLSFIAKAGLLPIPEDSSSILKAINEGGLDSIIAPSGDTIDGSKSFVISGTYHQNSLLPKDSLILFVKDLTIASPNANYYPVISNITFSTNLKWIASILTSIKGKSLLILGNKTKAINDSLKANKKRGYPYYGFPITDTAFHILDFVKVYIK